MCVVNQLYTVIHWDLCLNKFDFIASIFELEGLFLFSYNCKHQNKEENSIQWLFLKTTFWHFIQILEAYTAIPKCVGYSWCMQSNGLQYSVPSVATANATTWYEWDQLFMNATNSMQYIFAFANSRKGQIKSNLKIFIIT